MKKKNWFYPLIAIAFILIITSNCKKDEENPPAEPSITADKSTVSQYEVVSLTASNITFNQTEYTGSIGGQSVTIVLSDDKLVFIVPGISAGAQTLSTTIEGKVYSFVFTVNAIVAITEPATYINDKIADFNIDIDSLYIMVDSIAKYGTVESETEKSILKSLKDSMNYFKQQFLLLSSEDQLKAANILSANMPEISSATDNLEPLSEEIYERSIFTKGSICNQTTRSSRMQCLMIEFNRIKATFGFIEKLDNLLSMLMTPFKWWEKLPLKILSYSWAKMSEQLLIVGKELGARPYHPIEIVLNNPPTSFYKREDKSISLNIKVRNAKQTPDVNDKYWEKDFSNNLNALIAKWNSSLFEILSLNKRAFPLLIQPLLLPEGEDVLTSNVTNNSNVYSYGITGTYNNLRLGGFGTSESTTQNFNYNIEYSDDNFTLQSSDVSAVLLGTEPYTLVYISGNNQNGLASQQLAIPLKIRVNDINGTAIENVKVEFNIISGGGSLSSAIVYTNPSGEAQTNWTIGASGTQTVEVVVKNSLQNNIINSPYTFSATIGCSTFVSGGYEAVQIGSQIWMAKNLNIATTNSWCYDDNSANCTTYGRLYDWNAALTACPAGWHLPSHAEWTQLTIYLGDSLKAGGKLKSTSSWNSPNTGATNEVCFSALPGGFYSPLDGTSYAIGIEGRWWSSTEITTNVASKITMFNDAKFITYDYENWAWGLSVRCLKN